MAGRPCTVCTGPKKDEVNAAIAAGKSIKSIAATSGHPRTTVRNHAESCVPRSLALAAGAAGLDDLAAGIGLGHAAVDLQRRTLAVLTKAETTEQLPVALDAIRTARLNLELLGKLTGKLRPDTQVNVLVTSPDWLAMRERIAIALEPYPEALAAVREAFGAR